MCNLMIKIDYIIEKNLIFFLGMARPSRPARRAESLRGGRNNTGYSAHYAESPVIPDDAEVVTGAPPPRTSRRSIHSRSSTLPRGGDVVRSPSRHSRPGSRPGTQVNKGHNRYLPSLL